MSYNLTNSKLALLACACLLVAGARASLRAQDKAWAAQPHQSPASQETARCHELYEGGDFAGSAKCFNRVVFKNENDAEAWHFLGLSLKRAGDLNGARAAILKEVNLRLLHVATPILRSFFLSSLKEAAESVETYLQLAPKDSAFWRDQLDALRFYIRGFEATGKEDSLYLRSELDTPAVIVKNPEPLYSEEARREGVNATMKLEFILAADGTVQHILVITPLPYGLNGQSISAARGVKFKPGIKDGHPTSQLTSVVYSFRIY